MSSNKFYRACSWRAFHPTSHTVTLIISDEDINTAASKQAEVAGCLKQKADHKYPYIFFQPVAIPDLDVR
jgi:hypothetical protein